jgi:thiol:disulfide interchange protein
MPSRALKDFTMSSEAGKRTRYSQIALLFVGLGVFVLVSAMVIFFLSGSDSSWPAVLFGILFLMWGLVLLGARTLKSDSSHGPAKEVSVSPSRFRDLFTPPDDAEM